MLNIPTHFNYQSILTTAGLSPAQAVVYEYLLHNGSVTAGTIAKALRLERTLVYRLLTEMTESDLVIKKDAVGKVAVYAAAHPGKIKELARKKEEQAKNAQSALDGVLGRLTSDFNLASGRPGVRFFEGIEGIREVAFDNLTTNGEILAYLDMDVLYKNIPEINDEYVKVRRRLKIKKRNLVNDTPGNRAILADYNRDITDVRTIQLPHRDMLFKSMLQIYDNKVSYMTFQKDKWIGVIIEDANIADLHRELYEYTWQQAKPLSDNKK